MEANIDNKEHVSISGRDKAIVKAVRTLGYDQTADVTIRKTVGLTFIFESGKNAFVRL